MNDRATEAGSVGDQREQQLVRDFFGGARSGFFVEVGANQPKLASQSWHLEALGWSGVLIEPLPDLAAILGQTRRAKVFAVACSSPENAGRRMPLHVAGALSSLDRDRMAPGARTEGTIEVPVRTLDDILTEIAAPVPLDLLSVDVEGHELEVLKGFDIARWRPRLVLLEDHVGNLKKHRFLTYAGYRLIRRVENNGWYVPGDAAIAVAPRERWEIVRKYYLALPFRIARNASRRLRQPIKNVSKSAIAASIKLWTTITSFAMVATLSWSTSCPASERPASWRNRASRNRRDGPPIVPRGVA